MTRHVALLVGSLRSESHTRKLGNALIALAPPSLRIDEIEIGHLPHYNSDLEKHVPLEWSWFRERIRSMDAALFATPEYNRSIPGVLKNAIDIGSRPYGHSVWAGKPAAVASGAMGNIGGFGANHHLRQCLVYLDMPCMQQPEIYIPHWEQLFDAKGTVLAASTRELLQKFMTAFATWVERNAAVTEQHEQRKSA